MLPNYVLPYKKKGYKIKIINDKYYLYKTTSKYVKGMKNPQAVDTYIGVITEDGLNESKVKFDDLKSYEFGCCMYLDYLAKNILKEYGDKVRIKAILIVQYGIHIFQHHYEYSYLSIIYPNMKIDYSTSVDKEASKLLVYKIENNVYSDLFGIHAIKVNNKWFLTNQTEEKKTILKKYNIRID